MLTQIIVLVILLAIVAGGIWAFRKSRSIQAEADEALRAMGRALETTFDARSRSLTGHLNGRAVSVKEDRQGRDGEYEYFVRIGVSTATSTTLQLLRQGSGFVPSFVDDLKTGDRDFDRWFIVRTNDAEKVRALLTPDLRRQYLEWQTHGWLWEVRVQDGQLRYAGGQGLFRRDQIEKTMGVLTGMAHLAERLE